MNNLIIGIAGGSGSGKTTLALRLKERFGEDEVRLISHDSYYKRHDELPFEERCKLNYDPHLYQHDYYSIKLRKNQVLQGILASETYCNNHQKSLYCFIRFLY